MDGTLNTWKITFWGASSLPSIAPSHLPKIIRSNQSQIIKNPIISQNVTGQDYNVSDTELYIGVVAGTLFIIIVVVGLASVSTFWKRINRKKNRSALASAERYIPLEDELDDAFLEEQLRAVIEEEI